jgi:hypothetical protein
MTSERKIAANQNNAQKSTGPRSEAGREISRRNSLRHGLAIDIGADPAFHDGIQKLAKVLSPSGGTQKVDGDAYEAAAAQFDLLRIRRTRAWLFETLYFAQPAAPDSLEKLNDRLAKLERYERRAFSRRKRALRCMSGCAML